MDGLNSYPAYPQNPLKKAAGYRAAAKPADDQQRCIERGRQMTYNEQPLDVEKLCRESGCGCRNGRSLREVEKT